jgi:hypothetical protein
MKWTRLIAAVLGGAFIGAILSSWLAPKGIAWYFDPPVNIGINCREATEWAMGNLIKMQLFGIVGGGGIAAILNTLSRKKTRKVED